MAKWNPLALKILLWVMGVLLVVGSAATFIGDSVFNFGSSAGTTGPVAGIAAVMSWSTSPMQPAMPGRPLVNCLIRRQPKRPVPRCRLGPA